MHEPDRINTTEVMRRLNAHETVVFVDARTVEDWSASEEMIGGAIRVPPDGVAHHAGQLPSDPLVLYCTTPNQATSMAVARELISRGFRDLRVLDGGLEAWKQAGGYVVARLAAGDRLPKTRRPMKQGEDAFDKGRGVVAEGANVPREGVGAGTVVETSLSSPPGHHHQRVTPPPSR